MRTPSRNNGAFTLIELLICIAIMAVLAGLLLPSIQGVRRGAKQTQCVSQLRQIGTAMFAYAADHDNAVPPGYDKQQGYAFTWQSSLEPYLGAGKWMGPGYGTKGVFLCTAFPAYKLGENEHGGYVMPRPAWNEPAWPRLNNLPNLSSKVMLFEGDPTSPSLNFGGESDLDAYVKFRHMTDGKSPGNTLLLMADGQVRTEKRDALKLEWFVIP